MIYLNIILTVQDPANIETVKGLLGEAARLSREEAGCLRFEVYHSTADETKFILNEHWASPEAVEGHRTGVPYTQIYRSQVIPLVEREGHPSNLL